MDHMRFTFFLLLAIALPGLAGTLLSSRAQDIPRTVWDGVYSGEQSQRGEKVYVEACSNCHGRTLEGADMTPALTGGAIMSNLGGLTGRSFVVRIPTY